MDKKISVTTSPIMVLVQYAIENCPNLVDIEVQANEDQISDMKDSTLLEAYQWSTGNIFLRLHGLLGCEK